jgi:hypothetical protein
LWYLKSYENTGRWNLGEVQANNLVRTVVELGPDVIGVPASQMQSPM